jgi:hypothetical protein
LSVPPATEYSGGHGIYDSNFAQELTLDPFLPDTVPVYPNLNNFPAFFEQVMLPNVEMEIPQETQQPRGVFDFMLDTDFIFPENDLFDTNFMPDLDRILDTGPSICGSEDLQNSQLGDHESASRRAAAFRKSFWYVKVFRIVLICSGLNFVGFGCQKRTNMRSARREGFLSEMGTLSHRSIETDSRFCKYQGNCPCTHEMISSNWSFERPVLDFQFPLSLLLSTWIR